MIRHVIHLAWQMPGGKSCIKCNIYQNGDHYTIGAFLPKQSSIVVVRGPRIHVTICYREKIIYRLYNGYSCPFAIQTEYINCVDQRTYYCYYHANGALRSVDIFCRAENIHHDGQLACNQCKNVLDYSTFVEEAFPDIVQRFMNFIRRKNE